MERIQGKSNEQPQLIRPMGSVIPDVGGNYSRYDHTHQDLVKTGVKLNIQPQKNSAGGIKDDESILCATPPEYADERQFKYFGGYQGNINVTVNIDTNYNPQHMINRDLYEPNPQHHQMAP